MIEESKIEERTAMISSPRSQQVECKVIAIQNDRTRFKHLSTQGYSFEEKNNCNNNDDDNKKNNKHINVGPPAPDASEYNNKFNELQLQLGGESHFSMEGHVWKHSMEKNNVKISCAEKKYDNDSSETESPCSGGKPLLTQDKEEEKEGNNNDTSINTDTNAQVDNHVTDYGPGLRKGCQNSRHLKSFILTICLWLLIIMKLICAIFNDSFCSGTDSFGDKQCSSFCAFAGDTQFQFFFWMLFIIVVIAYIVECVFSSSRKYLSNIYEKEGMISYIDNLKHDQLPQIWWRVDCYHYETRTRTVTKTDSNGKSYTETETYTERVTTWTGRQTYDYRICNDISGNFSFETIEKNKKNDENNDDNKGNNRQVIDHLIIKLKLFKRFTFGNVETAVDYNYKAMLFRWYNNKDTYQDFIYGIDINGFEPKLLGELEPGDRPECMSLGWFWITSAIGCSLCFRLWFSSLCHKKTFLINKQISI